MFAPDGGVTSIYQRLCLSWIEQKPGLSKRMAVNPLLPRAVAGTNSNKCDWSDDS